MESPVIKLPDQPEIKRRLDGKLNEYKKRLERTVEEGRYHHPAQRRAEQRDTRYKIDILERLLEDGQVKTWDHSQEINRRDGEFDFDVYNNAAAVILSYVENS